MRYFLLALFITLLFPSSVFAQENTLRLSPAFVDVTLKDPMDEEIVDITLENRSNKPLSVELFTLDFNQKDEFGTVGFLGREIGNYTFGLSSFVSFENNKLEFKPDEKKTIPVTITNRQDLTPGGHYAAVIARIVGDVPSETTVSPAVSALIYLVKEGGERYNASLKSVEYVSPVSFSYPTTSFLTLQNDGNVHVIPYGTADVYDMFGRKIYKGIINEPSVKVLPQSIRRVPVYFKKTAFSFPISINTLVIVGRDSRDKISFGTKDVFIYINVWFVSLIVVSIVLIVILLMRKKRHDKKN